MVLSHPCIEHRKTVDTGSAKTPMLSPESKQNETEERETLNRTTHSTTSMPQFAIVVEHTVTRRRRTMRQSNPHSLATLAETMRELKGSPRPGAHSTNLK